MDKQSMTLTYRIAHTLFNLLFKLLTRLDVRGLERIPMEGPLLMTVNHTTVFEAPLVLALSPRQPITAMAKKEYQGTPIGKILDIVSPVYVHRGEVDRQALREMLKRLKAGGAIGIAPEGTRSPTGEMIEGKEGTAYLALQTDAWILPIAVWGHETLMADLKRFHRPVVHVRIGEPFKLEKREGQERKALIEEGTQRIMHAIARLLPPKYRGVYGTAIQGPPEW